MSPRISTTDLKKSPRRAATVARPETADEVTSPSEDPDALANSDDDAVHA